MNTCNESHFSHDHQKSFKTTIFSKKRLKLFIVSNLIFFISIQAVVPILFFQTELGTWGTIFLTVYSILVIVSAMTGYYLGNIVKKGKDSNELLEFFMTSLTDSFIIVDSELNIIDLNNVALKRFNLMKIQIKGKNLKFVFPMPEESPIYKIFLEVIKTGESFNKEDFFYHPKYGELTQSIRAFKVGNDLGIVETDISTIRKASEAAQKLAKTQADFFRITQHELRTPATVIEGYLSFFEMNSFEFRPDEYAQIFKIIRKNVDRLKRLISSVTDLSKIENRNFNLVIKRTNFSKFHNEMFQTYQKMYGKNQFTYTEIDELQPCFVLLDTSRFLQVMDNIIGNAFKHTDNLQRMITVNTEIFLDFLRINVSDNGAGISPDNLEKIFKQFMNIPTEYSVKGTGLGLFIARTIIEKHGGKLTAYSEGVGKGSTFIIELRRYANLDIAEMKQTSPNLPGELSTKI